MFKMFQFKNSGGLVTGNEIFVSDTSFKAISPTHGLPIFQFSMTEDILDPTIKNQITMQNCSFLDNIANQNLV